MSLPRAVSGHASSRIAPAERTSVTSQRRAGSGIGLARTGSQLAAFGCPRQALSLCRHR
jgi:hypothetical protein